jgi:hypothetical protein
MEKQKKESNCGLKLYARIFGDEATIAMISGSVTSMGRLQQAQ